MCLLIAERGNCFYMRDLLDMHMHTIVSGHAYSTMREMFTAGKEKGLQLIGITEHAPKMPGSCHTIYFHNFKVVRSGAYGIDTLMGSELNIMDYTGKVDLTDFTLKKLDYAIASLHDPCFRAGTREQNTAAVLGAMANPYVTIIGHPDNGRYPLDYEAIVKDAKKHHVLLELNNSSYSPQSGRPGSRENAHTMLTLCKQYEVPVIMDSDAHIDLDVGNHIYAKEVLNEANFPEELVVNTDPEKFRAFLRK